MGKRLTQLATRWREKPVWAGARGRGAGAAHKSDGEMGGQPVSGVHEVRAARLRSELQVSAYGQVSSRRLHQPPRRSGAASTDADVPRRLEKNLRSRKGSRLGNAGNRLELQVLTQLHHVP